MVDAHSQSTAPQSATAPKQTIALSVRTARAWRDPAAVAGDRYRLRHRRARLTHERRDHYRLLKETQLHPESKGDRLELRKLGLILRGTVLYADQVQVLVKWDNGRSSSLRAGVDDLDVTYAEVTSHALV